MAEAGPVLAFNSGIGGLSVLRAIRRCCRENRFVYVADDAAFPYGDWEEGALREHIVALMGELIAEHRPAAVVIACNTASTLVLPPLRERFAVPFVGTVPAIKPAAEQTKSGVVAVLATPGTMKRDYTRELIRSFAQECHVRLVGAPDLARLAEARMRGEPIDRDSGRRPDRAVLRRDGGAADRHRRARLHALSVPDRHFGRACALAGQVARPGAGDRAAVRGGAGRAGCATGRGEHRPFHERAQCQAALRQLLSANGPWAPV